MSHNLYSRLTNNSDDNLNYPNLPKHQFFSILRELARNSIDIEIIKNNLKIDDDVYAETFFNYIMSENNVDERLKKIQILEDIHTINEHKDFSIFYPDVNSLMRRIGI